MTIQDEFDEADESLENVRRTIVEELLDHDVSYDRILKLQSMLDEGKNGLMNAAHELTRDELLTAKALAHETGWMLADVVLKSNSDIERIKLLEEIVDNLRSEELILGELSGDLRAQADEISELEKQVDDATKQQVALWEEVHAIKDAKERIEKITIETVRLQDLIRANEVLREKLETQRSMIENEIQSLQHEREEKCRVHDHWLMEKRSKQTQLSTLQDELYIAQQGYKKREMDQRNLLELIASFKSELDEVKSIDIESEPLANSLGSHETQSDLIDSALSELSERIHALREARVRRAVDSN